MKLGRITECKISDENENSYFAQVEGTTFRLDKDQIQGQSYHLGDQIKGLIYEDMNREARIQLDIPKAASGHYDWGTVTQVRKDLGVFVDIGLYQKDLVVSLDNLPDDKSQWPQKGDQLYLTMTVDNKNRFWGELARFDQMEELFIKAADRLMNQDLEVTIFQLKLVGALAISKENFRSFIHESEWMLPPRLGQKIKGRVVKVQSDGSLNLSLKPRAHEAISDDATMLIRLLEKTPNHFLPYHDKSDPEAIKREFGISKGQFKRAVGSLMKNKQIRQEANQGIYLVTSENE
ncbi:CvfB family protein [Facklamia sp. P12932]|uniref:CvfB family protein n=1 Tax=Facklamia sp. P12932 TaxID=3421947 RepID=UPI003D17D367